MTEVEYYVDVVPHHSVNARIQQIKNFAIDLLRDEAIDDPARCMFFRDPPHFTLLTGRTQDIGGIAERVGEIANDTQSLHYTIGRLIWLPTGNFEELRFSLSPNPAVMNAFRELQGNVLKATAPLRTQEPPQFYDLSRLVAGERVNVLRYHYPFVKDDAGGSFYPHGSVGRTSDLALKMTLERNLHQIGVHLNDRIKGSFESNQVRLNVYDGDKTLSAQVYQTFTLGGKK